MLSPSRDADAACLALQWWRDAVPADPAPPGRPVRADPLACARCLADEQARLCGLAARLAVAWGPGRAADGPRAPLDPAGRVPRRRALQQAAKAYAVRRLDS